MSQHHVLISRVAVRYGQRISGERRKRVKPKPSAGMLATLIHSDGASRVVDWHTEVVRNVLLLLKELAVSS
jgi:hypothetical protein